MSEISGWRRGSSCSDGACAEIKIDETTVTLRSSNRPDSTIELTAAEWEVLKRAILDGEF